jgi:carboxymethylenebutenolidase
VSHDFTIYPGAPHSFFDRKQTEFADASKDAWRRVREFVGKHTRR